MSFQDGSHDAVHAVHDSTIYAKDDRIAQIDSLNKTHVLDHVTHGEL
ncbi:MAG TPA: hypothetical protein VGH18_01840 [Gaiellaceae bacterium]